MRKRKSGPKSPRNSHLNTKKNQEFAHSKIPGGKDVPNIHHLSKSASFLLHKGGASLGNVKNVKFGKPQPFEWICLQLTMEKIKLVPNTA